MKSHFLMLSLMLAVACQSKPAETENTESNPLTEVAMTPLVVPIKTEFYPNGTLFRELNTQTLEAKIYTADGKLYLKGQYQDTSYQLNGIWEEWDRASNYKRFEITFFNNIENGPFTSFRDNGKIYVKGNKKNGVFSDTLKFYDKDENLFEIQVYKVDSKLKEGTKRIKTININAMRSDGTIEKIKGKLYRWQDGEKKEIDSDDVPIK